jgi:hypothetical protein
MSRRPDVEMSRCRDVEMTSTVKYSNMEYIFITVTTFIFKNQDMKIKGHENVGRYSMIYKRIYYSNGIYIMSSILMLLEY